MEEESAVNMMIFSTAIRNIHSPIIICGCHGSGTSYVTKLLRWLGLFVGADAGKFTDRKLHESKVYTKTNERILQALTGGCTFGMRTVDEEEWSRYFSNIENADSFARAAQEIDLEDINKRYWGINNVIQFVLRGENLKKKIWAWKDPRNSLTLPFWLQIYESARILVITQKWKGGGKGNSGSGSWFKNESTEEVRHIYMNPPALDTGKTDHYFFDFDQGLGDRSEFNRLLNWIGLPSVSASAYSNLLERTGYERRGATITEPSLL